MIDADKELKTLENSVRDIISLVLQRKFGQDWEKALRIPDNRVSKWRERKKEEERRLRGVSLESRILYYSDFYDLRSIIEKHWDDGLSHVFADKREVCAFLEVAERLRDPHAHRRDLHDYQKSLIHGISGHIRGMIMRYRGKKEDPDDFFPVLEAVSDSMGNTLSNPAYAQTILSHTPLRVGDEVEITGYSSDPLGDDLEFSIARIGHRNWSARNRAVIKMTRSDIGRCCDIQVIIRSKRDFHAYNDFDDYAQFRYVVLPDK